MKKLLVVLLSLGLIAAFTATASAADVKFSGSYYVVGVYDNNQQLADLDHTYSRAFFYQRIRIQPVFAIAEGLTFTTRFDAMEKQWGQTDWRGGFDDKNSSRRQQQSFGNPKIQESIEFERGYVTFKTAAGWVAAGIMATGKWGTDFGDDEQSRPRARFDGQVGPVWYGIVYDKEFEADTSSQAGYAGKADADSEIYSLYGLFNFKGGNAGLLYRYVDRRAYRPTANFRSQFHVLAPYFKATFGPVYLEGEFVSYFGKGWTFEAPSTTPDIDIESLGAYLKARVNLGPAYFGASVLWSSGDDGSDATKYKVGPASQDLEVGLILGNDALQTWENSSGNGGANAGTAFDSGKQNALMLSAFCGYDPTPKMNIQAMFVYAKRDKVPANIVSKNMGYEFDVTASYKIYDNLTYMMGAGYLWTGDYFKGTNANNSVGNNYLLMNRLSLSF